MLFASPLTPASPLRQIISAAYTGDETECVEALLRMLALDDKVRARIQDRAHELVTAVRRHHHRQGTLEAFLHEYDLSSYEGVVLMCIAEALLRIPAAATVDRQVRDKLSKGDWDDHLGHSQSLLVNASTRGLMLTGRMVRLAPDQLQDTGGLLGRLVSRLGEPVIRLALKQAMRILGEQFVMGRDIGEALTRSAAAAQVHARYSFDMLGEAAVTDRDAQRYTAAYLHAIGALARHTTARHDTIFARPSISVKLSALHPRYEFAQHARVLGEFVAGMERRQFHRDAGAGEDRVVARRRVPGEGADGVQIGRGVTLGIAVGDGRFAQHIEGIAHVNLRGGGTARQRLADIAPHYELFAQDAHRLFQREADHRFA